MNKSQNYQDTWAEDQGIDVYAIRLRDNEGNAQEKRGKERMREEKEERC